MNNDQIIAYGAGLSGAPKSDAGSTMSGQATFSGVYADVLQGAGCAGSALCHGGEGSGHLNLSSKQVAYDALVNVAAMGQNLSGGGPNCSDSGVLRVKPKDPAASLLIQKLENTQSCGTSMPPGSMLHPEQIEQVRSWIEHGANND
jgi:hypothetical protein